MSTAEGTTLTLYIDDKPYACQPGEMIIQVADREGIYIPRFCYHKKLSIAANCRMCLVEVEKAPKALPACATPVADGMRVFTRSEATLKAQKAVMEFLLINHPLDCPICDQGGECELQDLSMGFGGDVSRFTDKKRVVADEYLSSLISTHMTRCIQCTRCVRFGEEIAGVPELGAIDRGGHMKIGTYLQRGVKHELSGNVIDICPVGALTSRPFKFHGRSWEFKSHFGVSPHDCVGSNLDIQTVGLGYENRTQVMRVLPKDNEGINEAWLSDRDRFSYQAINHEKRLMQPMIRRGNEWQSVSWQMAFDFVLDHLKRVIDVRGADAVGGLISPNATVEELYLFQKWLRGIGVNSIDHRFRETDHRDDAVMPAAPGLGLTLPELAAQKVIMLIGANPRQDHPLVNHRIRQATLSGARVISLHAAADDFNHEVAMRLDVAPHAIAKQLATIVKAASQLSKHKIEIPSKLAGRVNADAKQVAQWLLDEGEKASVVIGLYAAQHPDASVIRYLAALLASLTGARFSVLTDGANAAGAWLAGAVPHRGVAGAALEADGADAYQMMQSPKTAYVLHNIEPLLDTAYMAQTLKALEQAEFVVAMTAFDGEELRQHANVLLPIATFSETSGTTINAMGDWQSFPGSVKPAGEARPAWKIYRVLGNLFDMTDFTYQSSTDVLAEVEAAVGGADLSAGYSLSFELPEDLHAEEGKLYRVASWPAVRSDVLVRHAAALQESWSLVDNQLAVNAATAKKFGLVEGELARVGEGDSAVSLPWHIRETLADDTVWLTGGFAQHLVGESANGEITIGRG